MRAAAFIVPAVLAATFLLPSVYAASKDGKPPEESAKTIKVADGLEATLWAHEPDVINPTNIDIDERGRVWVAEGANYRSKNTIRPEGDRIMILEDSKGTGVCDKATVFYQDKDLICPLGIGVVGNKVYVSMSPKLMVFTIDASGEKPVGPPEILFDCFSGYNYDHGLHKVSIGADGRLYFNSGNAGLSGGDNIKMFPRAAGIANAHGQGQQRRTGCRFDRQQPRPARQTVGTDTKRKAAKATKKARPFRCNIDGTNLETLGYNFRNNYEVTVDSFGTAWQSDNDDDGNQGVRLNFVMEGGDFGYAGWGGVIARYPTQSAQEAHWRQREPGVVPNLYNTGGGSPTGILVYEGDLLPAKYQGALISLQRGRAVVQLCRRVYDAGKRRGLQVRTGRTDQGRRQVVEALRPGRGARRRGLRRRLVRRDFRRTRHG